MEESEEVWRERRREIERFAVERGEVVEKGENLRCRRSLETARIADQREGSALTPYAKRSIEKLKLKREREGDERRR